VQYGTEIIAERLQLIAMLGGPLRAAYRAVAGDDHRPVLLPVLSISGTDAEDESAVADPTETLEPGAPVDSALIAERFRAALTNRRSAELERGLTLVGPHRDDVFFGLNGLPVKGYASHGESWSFALAAKLASAELLAEYDQVIITAAVFDDVPERFTAHVVRIEAGRIVDDTDDMTSLPAESPVPESTHD
jgi:DNA replication and repair protein RecF